MSFAASTTDLVQVGDLKLLDRSTFERNVIQCLTHSMPDRIDFTLVKDTNSIANKIFLTSMTSTITMLDQREMEVACDLDLHCKVGDFEEWAPLLTEDTYQAFSKRARLPSTAADEINPPTISFHPEQGWKEQVTKSCSDYFYNSDNSGKPASCPIYLTLTGNGRSHNSDGKVDIIGSFSDGARFGLWFWPYITIMATASGTQELEISR